MEHKAVSVKEQGLKMPSEELMFKHQPDVVKETALVRIGHWNQSSNKDD
jgi:hypothetical protein